MISSPVRACLLIGGRSSRMGSPKHLLTGDNGFTWIENSVKLLQPFVEEIIFSGAGTVPENLSHITRIPDVPNFHGPMTGLLAAMRRHPDSCWLLLACDMPCVSSESIKWLLSTRSSSSWGTVPRLSEDGFLEPLLALYEPQARVYLEELFASGCPRISMLAKRAKIETPIIPDSISSAWCNINTPEDLSQILS